MGTKDGFELARRALGSRVEDREIDVLDLSPETVGTFDVVLMLGILYHMKHPMLALEKVRSVTQERLIMSTFVDMTWWPKPAMAFYEGSEANRDPTNWWGPNPAAVVGMLRAVGFERVEIVTGRRCSGTGSRPRCVRGPGPARPSRRSCGRERSPATRGCSSAQTLASASPPVSPESREGFDGVAHRDLTRHDDVRVDAELELLLGVDAPVVSDELERREVAEAGGRVERRHDASGDRLVDADHRAADADPPPRPRVLLVRRRDALDLDRHPEPARVERALVLTPARELGHGFERHQRDRPDVDRVSRAVGRASRTSRPA